MGTRLMVVLVFVCAVGRFSEAQLQPTSPLNTSITNTGCGVSKLCVSAPSNCDPSGTSSCFFSSFQVKGQYFLVELSGTTSGYVALGLAKAGVTSVFACGNTNNTLFFQTAILNGTVLSPANVSTAYPAQGVVAQNQTLIQCIFNVTSGFNTTTKAADSMYNVTILNGTTNGTQLGEASTVFNSSGALDLTDVRANIPSSLGISRTGCGVSKLCVSSLPNCNLTGTSSCFFTSFQVKNQMFFFELSGTTSGYVALGLTKDNTTVVFVCGNNSDTASFFFQTATRNASTLIPANVATVYSNQGTVATKQDLIQCTFNTSTNYTLQTKATPYQITIMNGTTNGTQLGRVVVNFDSILNLDLADPTAANSAVTTSLGHVLAVLLSALTLHLL